jgi:hypothetical protein
VSPHVPNPEHPRDVRRNDLVGPREAFNSHQRVVVALEEEDSDVDIGVPDVDVVVQTGTQ